MQLFVVRCFFVAIGTILIKNVIDIHCIRDVLVHEFVLIEKDELMTDWVYLCA